MKTKGHLLAGGAALLAVALSGAPAARAQAVVAGQDVPFPAASPHPYPTGTGAAPAWSVAIDDPGVTYIAVHFDRFDLGPGDRVVVRSPDGRQRHVFAGRGKGGLGAFWATHIKGDQAVVELLSPAPHAGAWGVSIDRYAAGFLDLAGPQSTEARESICGTDDRQHAICYADDEPSIVERSRAVARLLVGGRLLCTGWLVGCQGHFLTNNHCIDDPALVADGLDPAAAVVNTDYEFAADADACGAPNCRGCFEGQFWTAGAALVGRSLPLDYAFIHLAGDPQAEHGALFLENRPPAADERIYIPQHPNGEAKVIGVESTAPLDESGLCEIHSPNIGSVCPGFGGPGDVTYFCDTFGGSSGSPVISRATHQVIALHHCGGCPNSAIPITAVILDLGPRLPACALQTPVVSLTPSGLAADDSVLGNGNSTAEPFEVVRLTVSLRNDGNLLATGVRGTLTTTTPGITVHDDTAAWPDIPGFASADPLGPGFAVEIDEGVPCGSVIDLDLQVTTDQGVFPGALQLPVGRNLAASGLWPATDGAQVIPDALVAGGATSTLTVSESFLIRDLTVHLSITHPDVGELEVDLTSPAGTTARLHDRDNDGTADLDGSVSTDAFDGEDVQGTWELHVTDRAQGNQGTLNAWSLAAAEAPVPFCEPVPCKVFASAEALPDPVCSGGAVTLTAAASSSFGQDCSGALEYRFKLFTAVLADWSSSPDHAVVPELSTTYTVDARDPGTLAQDTAFVPVTVLQTPAAVITQSPDPLCVELGPGTLDGGAGFVDYTWRDDGGAVVGDGRLLSIDTGACGRSFTLEGGTDAGCVSLSSHQVRCAVCTPPEVSPPGSPVPLRLGLDEDGTLEFGLLQEPGVRYALYHAGTVNAMLDGDWTTKICDLAAEGAGIWSAVDGARGRWTPLVPNLIFEGYWVVIAERAGLEGPYGAGSDGQPRTPDLDAAGSVASFDCP